jgi:hypothetical protein
VTHRPTSAPHVADHAAHDRHLIARSVSVDVEPAEAAEVARLTTACTECRALADDLRVISRATAAMLPVRRPRDFRLTAQQASSLKGWSFSRLLAGFAAPRFAVLQPLAGAAMAIGLILAVAGASLPTPGATDQTFMAAAGEDAATAAPGEMAAPAAGPTAGAPGIEAAPGDGEPDATTRAGAAVGEEPQPTSADAGTSSERQDESSEVATGTTAGPLLIGAGLVVAGAGVLLLLLRWLGRNRARDPLFG